MAGRPPGGSANGRERLLNACWDLMVELPVGERLTISAVCDRAGCTPPTLYHHFGDLASLERAASRRAFNVWIEDQQFGDNRASDPRERLVQHGQAYLQWAREHVDAYHALFSQPRRSPDPNAETAETPGFQTLLADLGEIHDLPASDPALVPLAFAYWSGLHGLATLPVTVPFFREQTRESVLEVMTHALVSREPISDLSTLRGPLTKAS